MKHPRKGNLCRGKPGIPCQALQQIKQRLVTLHIFRCKSCDYPPYVISAINLLFCIFSTQETTGKRRKRNKPYPQLPAGRNDVFLVHSFHHGKFTLDCSKWCHRICPAYLVFCRLRLPPATDFPLLYQFVKCSLSLQSLVNTGFNAIHKCVLCSLFYYHFPYLLTQEKKSFPVVSQMLQVKEPMISWCLSLVLCILYD